MSEVEVKKPYLSKTVWANALVALAGILAMFGVVPGLSVWMSNNSELILTVLGMVGVGLRMITSGKIELK